MEEDVVTAEHVKKLVDKVKGNAKDKKDVDQWLAQTSKDGASHFDLVDRVDWAEVSGWRDSGFIHVLENLHLGKALLKWHAAESKEKIDAEEEVKRCISKGGVTAYISWDDEDNKETFNQAKDAWNELHSPKCALADDIVSNDGWSDKENSEDNGYITSLEVEEMEQGGEKWIGKITAWYGTEEDGWHGCNMGFTIYNEDGTPIQPEKTVVHKLNIDPSCSISGYCNTANTVSLKVVSKDTEPVTLGDHFPGGEVNLHHSPRDARLLFLSGQNADDGYAFKFHWAANENIIN